MDEDTELIYDTKILKFQKSRIRIRFIAKQVFTYKEFALVFLVHNNKHTK